MTLRYPRPASLAELGPGHNVVESSAGTGKTFLLEHLFVDLVLRHELAADQILVVTFTEKAAAELVLRVRALLGELAALRPDHPQAIAAAGLGDDASWRIDERARARLHDASLAFHRASISTIHAFCQRVLREHAFAQGRLFDEELVDGKTVFCQALYETLRTDGVAEPRLRTLLGAWLSCGQSVKTLTELLWSCAEKGAEVLRPAFDEARLARELSCFALVEPDEHLADTLKVAGIHGNKVAAALRRLRTLAKILDASAGDPFQFLARYYAEQSDVLPYLISTLVAQRPNPTVTALAQQMRDLQEVLVPFPAAAVQLLLPVVQARAAARKRSAGHYDYGDMLALVAAALDDPGPAGRDLLTALRDRYRHGLIDEFQDTDRTQWQIFRRIFVEADDGRHGLTVVGDPKQSIYGFRSADVHTYLEASHTLAAAGAHRLTLQMNFRSTAPLIEATNLLFTRSSFFRPGSGIRYDHPVRCGRPERVLVDRTGEPAPPVVLLRLGSAAGSIRAEGLRSATAAAIVDEIRRLTEPQSPLELRDGERSHQARLRDIFILTFTNTECLAIGRVLGRAGIRHAFYKLGDLFASTEAAELRDVLFALCAPEDRDRRNKALLTRFFGLDLPALVALHDSAVQSRPAQLLLELAELARRADVPTLCSALLDRTGVIRRELWQGEGERGLTNLMHLLELLQAEWTRSHASLPELSRLLDAFIRGTAEPPGHDGDLQRLETDEDAVQILTVHKAKGLQADVVFLFGGLAKGNQDRLVHVFRELPGNRRALYVGVPEGDVRQRVNDERDDEQSRVDYVALTRARYRLYLPHYPPQFKVDGAYRRINGLLDELAAQPSADTRRLFESRAMDCAELFDRQVGEGATRAAAIPPDLLAIPTVPPELAAVRRERGGFLVTSYSAVKRLRKGLDPTDDDPAGATHDAIRAPGPDHLPGGAETGIFLHEVLAEVPLAGLADPPAFPAWQASVAPLLDRLCRRHAWPAEQREPAARLIHAAYTTPVRLGDVVIPRLAVVESALREMEFLYPLPEAAHPLLAHAGAVNATRRWRIERGVVKGYIDFLFAYGGRVFVCDWKSDDLMSYEGPTLARHCTQHYDVQARIYALATLRLFDITRPEQYAERFGGLLFCFLRARPTGDDAQGIVFRKPTWDEILGFEQEMEGASFWGLAR